MKVKLTILCENSVGVPFGVIGEHGFACYVETEKGNYLFDTGQGYTITRNATVLGKNIGDIDAVMISHGHYDHTGGLPSVLQVKGAVDVYAHPDIFVKRIWTSEDQTRYIGIPHRRSYLESLGANFRLGTETVQVGPGVFLTGEIPRVNAFETGDPHLVALGPADEHIQPDPLLDDLSLVIDSDKGLVILLGCAHAGMINIIEHTLKIMKRDRIFAIIGGTHLGFSTDAQFAETMSVIDRYGIERIGVSHCTGPARAASLYAKLGDRFFFGNAGAVLQT